MVLGLQAVAYKQLQCLSLLQSLCHTHEGHQEEEENTHKWGGDEGKGEGGRGVVKWVRLRCSA